MSEDITIEYPEVEFDETIVLAEGVTLTGPQEETE